MKAFRQYSLLFGFFLSVTLIVQTFPKTLYIFDYYLNMEKYAAYCINLDSPELHCEGSCQLAIKMNGVDDHQNDSIPPEEIIHSFIYLAGNFSQISQPDIFPNFKKFYPARPQLKIEDQSESLFRPPRIS